MLSKSETLDNSTTNLQSKSINRPTSDASQLRHSNNGFEVRFPIDVNFDVLFNPYKKNRKRGIDNNAFLIGYFVSKAEAGNLSFDTYFSLNSDVLRSYLGGDYKKYINALLNAGYLSEYSNPYTYTTKELVDGKEVEVEKKCTGNYSIHKGISKKYKLNVGKGHALSKVIKTHYVTDKKIIEKYRSIRVKQTQNTIEHNPKARHIYDTLTSLEVDHRKAIMFLRDKYNFKEIYRCSKYLISQIGNINTRLFLAELIEKKGEKSIQKIFKKYGVTLPAGVDGTYYRKGLDEYNKLLYRMSLLNKLKRISNGEHDLIILKEDKKTGRLFHTLTQVTKDLKPFVTFGGGYLVEIDGSNCQLNLLSDLIRKTMQLKITPSFLENNNNSIDNKAGVYRNTCYNQTILSCIKNIEPINHKQHLELEQELKRFNLLLDRDSMSNAEGFRDLFIQLYKKHYSKELSAGEVKMNVIKNILFINPDEAYYKNKEIVVLFRKEFPNILNMIERLKRRMVNNHAFGYSDKDRWKCLSLMLQKMETKIFVDALESLNVPAVTIHDSIVCLDKDKHILKAKLDELINKFNSNLKLKIKPLKQLKNDLQEVL